MSEAKDNGTVRAFETGATRDTAADKIDPEGFLSPLVLEAFAQYMHRHRVQSDGSLRTSDNWQKGMPRDVYMKSLFRHFLAAWKSHRGWTHDDEPSLEDSLCGILFNTMGYLHETLILQRYAAEEGLLKEMLEDTAPLPDAQTPLDNPPHEVTILTNAQHEIPALEWLKTKLGIGAK